MTPGPYTISSSQYHTHTHTQDQKTDTSMKDPCITRQQSFGIHDIVNDQGFTMYHREISNMVSHLKVLRFTVKQKGQTEFFSSFLSVECFKTKGLPTQFSRTA